MVDPTIQNFLRHNPSLYEEIKRGTRLIDVQYTWFKDFIVLNYVMGELPNYNKTWMNVDCIYIPYNIGWCHWISSMMDMVEGWINICNLFNDLTSDLDLVKELDKMWCVVLTLLHRRCVFTLKPNLVETLSPLYHVRDALPQMGLGNCEIYCSKFFKYNVIRSSFRTLIPDNILLFRWQLTIQFRANIAFLYYFFI